jgi:5'(3')-deoxyribonucleotidase
MNPRPIIAVDVDDVLAYHAEAFLEWSNNKYGTNLTIEDYTDHWSELWSITHEQSEERAIIFHKERQHRHFKPNEDALDVLLHLKKMYDLVIVTARRQEVVKDSKEWLKKYYPNIFTDVRFVPIWEEDRKATKAAICNELGASFLIDDMPRHCNLAAEEGITALLFGNFRWNRHEKLSDGVIKVKNWAEIKQFFDEKSG